MSKIMVFGYGDIGRTLVRWLSQKEYPPIESVHIVTEKRYCEAETEVMDCRSVISMVGSHTKILYHNCSYRGYYESLSSLTDLVSVVSPDIIVICSDEREIADVGVPSELAISLPEVYNILVGVSLAINGQYRPTIINCILPEIINYVLYKEIKVSMLGAGGIEGALIRCTRYLQDISGSEIPPKLSFAGLGVLVERGNYENTVLESGNRGVGYRIDNHQLLTSIREGISRGELPTSAQCIKIIDAVLLGIPYESHIPGLNGFPGSIKATVSGDKVELHRYATVGYDDMYSLCIKGMESIGIYESTGIRFTRKLTKDIEKGTGITFPEGDLDIYNMIVMSEKVSRSLINKGE